MQITRGKIETAQKVVIYGPEGIGKSTFAAQFPNPVFIDTEGSTKQMDVARMPKPSSWIMLMEEVNYIKANPNTCNTLVIDTADWAEQLCIDEICAKYQKKGIEEFGYGKGYVYLAEEFGKLLNALNELIDIGVHVVLTAHAQMRKFEQPDEMGAYDRWEMKLQRKTAPLVKEWADMVLFANYKTYVVNVDGQGADKGTNKVQGGKRIMYTTHHPCWDAKNRHNLKPELPFDFNEIKYCISANFKNDAQNQTKAEAPISAEKPKNQPIKESSKEQQSIKDETLEWKTIKEDDLNGIPKPLADLMTTNNVTIGEIQLAVASKGYYPLDTPITNYDPNFVTGVLVGAWPQVFKAIQQIRNEEVPF